MKKTNIILLITIPVLGCLIWIISMFNSFEKVIESNNETISMGFEMNPADSVMLSDSLRTNIIQKAVYYNKGYNVSQYMLVNENELIVVEYNQQGRANNFFDHYQVSKTQAVEKQVGIVYSIYDFVNSVLIKKASNKETSFHYMEICNLSNYNELKRTVDTLSFQCQLTDINFSDKKSNHFFEFGFHFRKKNLNPVQFLLFNRNSKSYLLVYIPNQKHSSSLMSFLRLNSK